MATVTQIDLMQKGVLAHAPTPFVWRPPAPMSDVELMEFSWRHRPYQIERNARGELEIMSPVVGEGGQWEAWIVARLTVWAEEHGGVSFSPSVGFTLPDSSVRSPDASWLPGWRWDALSEAERESFPPVCPDFVIELLLKSDARKALEAKMLLWIANGAQLAWMIDPFAHEIAIYQPGSEVVLHKEPSVVRAVSVVPGFSLDLAKLWLRQ